MYTLLHTTLYVHSLTYNTLCTLSYIQHSMYTLLHTTLYVHCFTYNTLMYTLLHTFAHTRLSFGDLTYLMSLSSKNSYEGQHINQDNEPQQLIIKLIPVSM